MNIDDHNLDKAGKAHWNSTERNTGVEFAPFEPLPGIRGFARRMWHNMFTSAFSTFTKRGKHLLELGCGGSAMLPYFATRHGFLVSGIDYSQGGCALARQMCQKNGVSADIFCADFFNAPSNLVEKFDVVASFGVVEHFTDTSRTVAHFAKFLRPGGLMLTVVPNMGGLAGLLQRILSRDVFDTHEVVDTDRLRTAHETAGLLVESCQYFLFVNFGVVSPGTRPGVLKRLALVFLRAATAGIWALESVFAPLPSNRWTSPYVVCLARLPLQQSAIALTES